MRVASKPQTASTDSTAKPTQAPRGQRSFKERCLPVCGGSNEVLLGLVNSSRTTHARGAWQSDRDRRPQEREKRPRDLSGGEPERTSPGLLTVRSPPEGSPGAPARPESRSGNTATLDAPVATWVTEHVTRLQIGERGNERTVRLRAHIAGRDRNIALRLSDDASLSVEIEDIEDPALCGFMARLRDSLATLDCEIR